VNTAVLLCSSFTVVLAVHYAHLGSKKGLMASLVATIILGGGFLCIKACEYYKEYQEHLIPGLNFVYGNENRKLAGIEEEPLTKTEEKLGSHGQTDAYAPQAKIFMSFYFMMTGVHATHMIVGLGLFIWLLIDAKRDKFSPEYFVPVENCGLYWH